MLILIVFVYFQRMDYLWKKETVGSKSMYCDIFSNIQEPNETVHNRECTKSIYFGKDDERSNLLRMHGNNLFRLKDWTGAMEFYNQSLYYAKCGSENEALAYSNRSSCFFKLNMFDSASIDIELAKQSSLPKHLLPKLEQRKQECENKIEKYGKTVFVFETMCKLPTLSYEASTNFPCMANVLEIKRNEEFGRHLVATRDIPAKKTILIEEDFIVAAIESECSCYTCLVKKQNFIACPDCSGNFLYLKRIQLSFSFNLIFLIYFYFQMIKS